MKEKRLFYFVSVFKGVNLAELIVLVEIDSKWKMPFTTAA